MDNMLYIIAGLVLILIVAVLVIRKNKAQKPSDQASIKTGKTESLSTPTTLKGTPVQVNTTTEKKLDYIEIAQRFMDQKRYDKAIEALNRGLSEKPNDSQLSLKLLAVYATIEQSDNFNKVYDSIKAHNDAKSIAQADKLKALLTEEQNQIAKQAMSADNSQDSGFESIDFDISTSKAVNNNPKVAAATAQQITSENDLLDSSTEILELSNDFDSFDNIEQEFDLNLNDLEDNISESANTSVTPVTTLDITDGETLDTSITVTDVDSNDFDFALSEPKDDTSTESPVATLADDDSNEITLDEEDFFLDLAELDSDASTDNVNIDNDIATNVTQTEEDGLTLSLGSSDVSDQVQNHKALEQPISTEDNFDDFSFEDVNIEDSNIIENKSDASSMSPSTIMFDDNTLIDDDFDFDALSDPSTAIMPVKTESDYDINNADINSVNISGTDHSDSDTTAKTDIETAEDFSSQFAADFDFVKTLDSNQVTLDLAGQYVQLGEYDSAKRLLNEVLTQGSNEQQQQAQLLLERTA